MNSFMCGRVQDEAGMKEFVEGVIAKSGKNALICILCSVGPHVCSELVHGFRGRFHLIFIVLWLSIFSSC